MLTQRKQESENNLIIHDPRNYQQRRITTNQGSLTKELKAMFGYLEWGMLWNREE